jgi:centrin-3
MDMKKKGYLNSYEFRHSLAALGFDLPKPEYCKHLESYGSIPPDWPSSTTTTHCPVNRLIMPLDQFRICAARLLVDRDPREEAAKVFNMFDYDQDGIISLEDMRRLAQDIKEERAMSDEEIQGMIEYLDHDGKGGVNLEEFIQMMEEAG